MLAPDRAPELILELGTLDHKIDIWSAGCLLFSHTHKQLLKVIDASVGDGSIRVSVHTFHSVFCSHERLVANSAYRPFCGPHPHTANVHASNSGTTDSRGA